ncbi:hypothetical protein JW968_00290 [Candidatus Woesearchaeota archaeon]|nr:hypothetical protein [Candidatus Woesearchaeota archaeon]
MNTQVNIRMPSKLLVSARNYAKKHGFGTLQDFIKETVREKVFEPELTAEEAALIKKLKRVSDERGLYGTEEDLFKALRRR